MIARYGPCWGLTLFRWGRLKVELWFSPADYSPLEHTHDDSDGEFMVLWSRNREIYRLINGQREAYIANTPEVWGRWFSVRAGTPHSFGKGDSCMVWLCVERWKPGSKVTSVATDLHLT